MKYFSEYAYQISLHLDNWLFIDNLGFMAVDRNKKHLLGLGHQFSLGSVRTEGCNEH